MPRAFRSRQFLIDLALKGSLRFPTVSSTFSVSGRFGLEAQTFRAAQEKDCATCFHQSSLASEGPP